MTGPAYDCIVIGVGGIGSAALYHIARRGGRVLGIDQFGIAHDKGSSHGDSRAIRLAYFEHPDYVPLLRRAYELWDELNNRNKNTLFYRSGILQAGPPGGEVMSGLLKAAEAHQLPIERLSCQAVRRRFPGFNLPESNEAIFDPDGGILRVEDCVRAHIHQALDHDASLKSNETVRHWYKAGKRVTVDTDHATYTCNHLIITPGPWAPRLLPAFAPNLRLVRKSLFWFDNEDDCYALENGCPVFLFEQGKHTFYGFPALDEKGIKVADHSGGRPLDSPAALDRHVDTTELESLSLMLRQYLPRAGHQLNDHTTCMYTMTPDSHFMVGPYPGIERVSVVAGLSGHGFKFATVLGEIMADLGLEGKTAHPIDFLSPRRFAGMKA